MFIVGKNNKSAPLLCLIISNFVFQIVGITTSKQQNLSI